MIDTAITPNKHDVQPNVTVKVVDKAVLKQLTMDIGIDPLFKEKLEIELAANETIVFAAQFGNMYVGYVCLRIAAAYEQDLQSELPGVPVVYSLVVQEAQRHQGIANQLMQAAENEATRLGFDKIALGVVPENDVARLLYEKRGYTYLYADYNQTIASHWTITDKNGQPLDVVVELWPMVKSL